MNRWPHKLPDAPQKEGGHDCSAPEGTREGGYGPAVTNCYELDDGTLVVENGEYATEVNFCPFCGFKAERKIGATHKTKKPLT